MHQVGLPFGGPLRQVRRQVGVASQTLCKGLQDDEDSATRPRDALGVLPAVHGREGDAEKSGERFLREGKTRSKLSKLLAGHAPSLRTTAYSVNQML